MIATVGTMRIYIELRGIAEKFLISYFLFLINIIRHSGDEGVQNLSGRHEYQCLLEIVDPPSQEATEGGAASQNDE